MYLGDLTYNIEFDNEGKKYKLLFLIDVTILKSVDTLADTAIITLPATVHNNIIDVSDKIKRGTKVSIELGYDNKLQKEFSGYVLNAQVSNDSIIINCEDSLFLFRKALIDKEYKEKTVKQIVQDICKQLAPDFKVNADQYDIGYDKFTVYKATGYDVLKKIAEETKANIWFNEEEKKLHIHPPYINLDNTLKRRYSLQQNVENSSLEYVKKDDYKCLVTVQKIGKDGKIHEHKSGDADGDTFLIKVGSVTEKSIKQIADSELIKRSKDAYTGSFDTWLIPYVEPSWSLKIEDSDYPDQDATYYCVSVKTSFRESGGQRTITPGVRLV